jgi:hypothetical protein
MGWEGTVLLAFINPAGPASEPLDSPACIDVFLPLVLMGARSQFWLGVTFPGESIRARA